MNPEITKYDPELATEIKDYGEDNIGEDLTAEDVYELTALIKDTFGSKT